MDKKSRKQLISEYKKQELEKELDNPNFAGFAKIQLGISSGTFNAKEIEKDKDLVESFIQNTNETATIIYKKDPRKHKSRENVIKSFSVPVKAVYYTVQFESMLEMGDTDKFLYNSSEEEIDFIIQGYKLFGLESIAEMIKLVLEEVLEISDLESKYYSNLEFIKIKRIEFIRNNSDNFNLD